MQDDKPVDITHFIPLRGLVIPNENFAQNVGNSALFLANGFIASSRNQPLIRHTVRSIPVNVAHRFPEVSQHKGPLPNNWDLDSHQSGPFLLNRTFAGMITVLPIAFARKFDMTRARKWDIEDDYPPTFDEIEGKNSGAAPLRKPDLSGLCFKALEL